MDLRREECCQAAGINERVLSLQGSRTRLVSRLMDPELAAAATMLEKIDPDNLVAHREVLRRLHADQTQRWTSDLVTMEDLVPGTTGQSPPVPVRIYRPLGLASEAPTLLWLHGGAFSLGFAAIDDDLCTRIAAAAGYVIVSPEYRLAPEHPFPAGFSDCLETYKWLLGGPATVGVDPNCIVVGGTSAGAGLAACVCLKLRDDGCRLPAVQLLACPVIDDRLQTMSMTEFVDTPVLDQYQARLMWRRYLSSWDDEVPPYAAAGRAQDLRGLPPAYIETAHYDPLRDEGIEYARRLLEAGNSVELHHFPGTFHSFDMIVPSAAISRRAFQNFVDVLRAAASKNAGRA